ncbi:extracellular solute-binding protein [Brachybacterium huguangmaarense]|uniref:Extracellular solute-binding protein n=1 Tax=Brachybacterium huguangmaarense TaxID=1652028 RepID=A0ABY6G3Y1_9MICO|nr:extracellular solute-binding protein [Brachybacterium huguangmaarense]UYG17790.1 extracellular solute-binding protein [Brachybacterium huguangmaarense]
MSELRRHRAASSPPPGPRPRSGSRARTTSRRAVLGGGAAALAAGLAACTSTGAATVNSGPTIPASSGKVTLTYWAWLKDLQKVADVYNATQDRIEVRAVWIPGGDSGGYAKILSAVAAGGGPDIAQVELRAVPEFALAGALTDVGRYGALDKESAFDPGAFAQVKIGDSVWAIPQDTGPAAMFYNRQVLEDELGLTPPETWDEFRELAQHVKDAGKTIMTIDPGDGSVLPMWAMQRGANWFEPKGDTWVLHMADDVSLEVADFWDGIIKDQLIGTGYGSFSTPWMAAAGKGDVLSYIGGSWGDALIEGVPDGSGKWKVAPMPRWQDGYASGGLGGSSAAVLSTSQHPAEALEFLTWMCTDPAGIDAMIEYSGIGWSPSADYIGKEREKPSEFFSGQNYNEDVILPMAKGQNLDWVWAPLMQRVNARLGDGMLSVVGGSNTFTKMLPQAQDDIADIMRKIGLNVEVAK